MLRYMYFLEELNEEKFSRFEFYPQTMAPHTENIFYGEEVTIDVAIANIFS